ncbi:iron ABC transporter permease [Pseudonocardia sp. NPDC049635]|uniref:FecCD family ABC transporter permease n=1 Tax=Pseudonocardia sp. NPDC049635 TaxID=3155506 RepID=UPI0033FE6397
MGRPRRVALAACIVLLIVVVLSSMVIGARSVGIHGVWLALTDPVDPRISATDAVVVRTLRLPRTVAGVIVGAALGLAGALMQALTRNPLADPGVLGVNAGASFCVVLVIGVLGGGALAMALGGLIGAAGAVAVVILLAWRGTGRASPARLVLVGAATSAVLGGATSALVVFDAGTFDQVRFWTIGSLAGRESDLLWPSVALVLLGLVVAVLVAASLDSLALGDELAVGLGTSTARARLLTAGAVAVLCGTATAVAGPIGFVGLAVPHAARALGGQNTRWLIAFSLVLGAVLLLGADVIGRLIAGTGELQAGLVTAAIGGPLFIAIARRRKLASL